MSDYIIQRDRHKQIIFSPSKPIPTAGFEGVYYL